MKKVWEDELEEEKTKDNIHKFEEKQDSKSNTVDSQHLQSDKESFILLRESSLKPRTRWKWTGPMCSIKLHQM